MMLEITQKLAIDGQNRTFLKARVNDTIFWAAFGYHSTSVKNSAQNLKKKMRDAQMALFQATFTRNA